MTTPESNDRLAATVVITLVICATVVILASLGTLVLVFA